MNINELEYEFDDVEYCEQIDDFEEEYVYDIEVDDESHTFIANDILVHNSLYVSFSPVIKSCNYEGDELEFILSLDRIFVKEMFTSHLNGYAKKYKVKNIHDFELETVNASSLHLEKKMYINNVVWEDGIFFKNMEHFIPKGIDIVRSSTPPFVRGKKQKGGVWEIVNYLFREAGNLKSSEILKMLKNLKSQFMLANIEDISFNSTLSNYDSKVIDDQAGVECVKAAHHAVKSACLHNYLLNKNSELKSKYDLLKGGRIKWYFIKDYPLNDRFAYLRSFHPYEIIEKEKIQIDYDTMFEIGMLGIVNRFLDPIGLPPVNARLGVLNSIFGNIDDISSKNEDVKGESKSKIDSFDNWDDDFDF